MDTRGVVLTGFELLESQMGGLRGWTLKLCGMGSSGRMREKLGIYACVLQKIVSYLWQRIVNSSRISRILMYGKLQFCSVGWEVNKLKFQKWYGFQSADLFCAYVFEE
eukprot:TRINITY_DN3878_c1_g4_i1.p3 TRINITY_DN3878_c1_g4~~TRINITY_DN3878_c1_g4_i1.p3  ORF type:complete len:108 (-),score=6.83 TRINITY_DN3878_c1_g4_i1:129-452(-)